MGLAAFLTLSGFDPARLEMAGARSAQWVFESEDGIADLAREYRCGDAEVEPKEFIRVFSRTRSALYDFLRDNGVVR